MTFYNKNASIQISYNEKQIRSSKTMKNSEPKLKSKKEEIEITYLLEDMPELRAIRLDEETLKEYGLDALPSGIGIIGGGSASYFAGCGI